MKSLVIDSILNNYIILVLKLSDAVSDPTALNELSKQTLNIIQTGSLTMEDIVFLTDIISQTVHLVNQNTSIETVQVHKID